jgi:hypothetical protein
MIETTTVVKIKSRIFIVDYTSLFFMNKLGEELKMANELFHTLRLFIFYLFSIQNTVIIKFIQSYFTFSQ